METSKQALLGTHHKSNLESLTTLLKEVGYTVTKASSFDEIKKIMGITQDTPPEGYSLPNHYDIVIMDVNLGAAGSETIFPGVVVYNHIKEYVKRGDIKFMSHSANPTAVAYAKIWGIPCVDTLTEYDKIIELVTGA